MGNNQLLNDGRLLDAAVLCPNAHADRPAQAGRVDRVLPCLAETAGRIRPSVTAFVRQAQAKQTVMTVDIPMTRASVPDRCP